MRSAGLPFDGRRPSCSHMMSKSSQLMKTLQGGCSHHRPSASHQLLSLAHLPQPDPAHRTLHLAESEGCALLLVLFPCCLTLRRGIKPGV